MRAAAASGAGTRPAGGPRCRCGHLPTHHMEVVAIGSTASFRLTPTSSCAVCGESICRHYTPGGP
ncbi:MAG TPA: hypothetical protein VK423_05135 [Thermoplasmata archaeon]|nr:hypothetical protein [Thermoplasmata archaeon]